MNNSKFFMIPFSLYEMDLPKNAIKLYGILYGNANKLGYAFGTNKYYAKLLNCSERTISNSIKILKDKNLISIKNHRSFRRQIFINNC